MMIRAHLTIHGRVQGVYYRKLSKSKALELMIKGWVANEADGTVSVVAEGPENNMDQFIDWCHSGPSRSEVTKVEVEKSIFTNEFGDFEVRY